METSGCIEDIQERLFFLCFFSSYHLLAEMELCFKHYLEYLSDFKASDMM